MITSLIKSEVAHCQYPFGLLEYYHLCAANIASQDIKHKKECDVNKRLFSFGFSRKIQLLQLLPFMLFGDVICACKKHGVCTGEKRSQVLVRENRQGNVVNKKDLLIGRRF